MARQMHEDSLSDSEEGQHAASDRDGDQIVEEINSLIYYNDRNVIEDNIRFIVRSLKLLSNDKNGGHRLKFLSFIKECIPQLEHHKDYFLAKMLPDVLGRICDRRMSTVRKAIRTVHFMFRNTKTAGQTLLKILVRQGIESKSLSLQTACISRLSMLISYRMSHLDFSELILSLLSKLDHKIFRQSQIRNALESLQELLGTDNFRKNVSRLSPARQSRCYEVISGKDDSQNSDRYSSSNDSYTENKVDSYASRRKCIPDRIIRGCYDSSFQVRLESLTEWKSFFEGHHTLELSEGELKAIFKHLFASSKEKSTRILEIILNLVSVLASRLVSLPKMVLQLFLELILTESLNATETMKTLRYEILGRLNSRVSSPNRILEVLNMLIRDCSVSVKREAIDFISYVVLLNERAEKLNIESLYKIIVVSVLNDNSSVRYAAMECLVIFHSVCKRNRNSLKRLISTIQPAEQISGGSGITEAFQTRLNRHLMARINSKGLLVYGLSVPSARHNSADGPLKFLDGKDIDWILNAAKGESQTLHSLHQPSYINKRRRLSDGVKSSLDDSARKSTFPLDRRKQGESFEIKRDDEVARRPKQLREKPQTKISLTDSELKFPVKPVLARSAGNSNRLSQQLMRSSQYDIHKYAEDSSNEMSAFRNLRNSASRKMADRIFNDSGYMTVTDEHHRYNEDLPDFAKTKPTLRNVKKRDYETKKMREEADSAVKTEKVKDLVKVVDSLNMEETAVEPKCPLISWFSFDQSHHETNEDNLPAPAEKKELKNAPTQMNIVKPHQIKSADTTNKKLEKGGRLKLSDPPEERTSPSNLTGAKLCSKIMEILQDSDWEKKCEGLNLVSSSLQAGRLVMDPQTQHSMLLSIIPEIKNLRSQVSKTAITCVSTMFTCLKTDLNSELDGITLALMNKSGESGHFLQQEVHASLLAMIENVSTIRALCAIIDCGARHKNAQTRKLASSFVLRLVEMIGPLKILEGARETTLRVLPTISYFLCDNEPLTRYNGRKMVSLLMEHPSFEKICSKNMTVVAAKLITDSIDVINKKGLDEPPPENYSSRMKGGDGAQGNHLSDYYSNLKMRNDPNVLELDQILTDIATGDLRMRERGFSALIDVASTSLNAVLYYLKRIVDLLVAKLNEASTRSNLLALTASEQLLPLICEHMSDSLTKFLISAIVRQLMSKNREVLLKTNNVLDIFQQNIDHPLLITSLASTFANGTSLSKPLIVLRLSECISAMDKKKSKEISNYVLPLFWKLMEACSSTGLTLGGVVSLREATAKLASSLQNHMGSSLIAAAKTNSNISPKNLKLLFDLLES